MSLENSIYCEKCQAYTLNRGLNCQESMCPFKIKDSKKAYLSRQKLELDIVRGKLNTRLVELKQDIKIIERAMTILEEEELHGILKQEIENIMNRVVTLNETTAYDAYFTSLIRKS